jgi:uncharacterized membrane protein YfcA
VDPLLIVFGLGVGLLVGMTGIGGGSLMTPLLIIVVGVQPVTAIGSDLAYGAVTKTVGGIKHLRQRTVAIRLSTWMAVGSVPAAVLGVYVLEALERAYGGDFDSLLLTMVAAAVLFSGVATLVRAVFLTKLIERERRGFRLTKKDRVVAATVGVVVGFVLGITSAGSGALIAVALIYIFRLVPTRVVGTDVFHAAVLLWAAALAHIVAGNVDYALVGTILLGSVPGVWCGSHLSVRLPTGALRTALGVVLIGAGLGLLSKAGVQVPAALIAAVPIALAILLVTTELARRHGPPQNRRAFRRARA